MNHPAQGQRPAAGFNERDMPLTDNTALFPSRQEIVVISESWANGDGWGREYEMEVCDVDDAPRIVRVFAEGLAGLAENEVVIHSVEEHGIDVRGEFDLERIEGDIRREVFPNG
jgi:hypothetical protein